MIDPEAIDRFMSRELRDSGWAKQLTDEILWDAVNSLNPKPHFELEPFTHQLVCFLLSLQRKSYFHQLDMGLGKTKVMIDVAKWLKAAGKLKRALVLVPSTSNVTEWGREIGIHAPELSAAMLNERMHGEQREHAFWNLQTDITVVTYRGLQHLLCPRQTRTAQFRPDPKLMRQVPQIYQMLVCDESTMFQNHLSVTFQILRKFVKTIEYRYCLSGTPFGSNPQGLWSQFFLTDGGETLGGSLGFFRECFFTEEPNRWSQSPHAKIWKLDPLKKETLHRMLRHNSVRYEETECQDLPEVFGGIADPKIRAVELGREQSRHFQVLQEEMQTAHRSGEKAEAIYYKLRCLSSGYLPTDHGFVDFSDNPKLEALMQLLDEAAEKKVIIFFHYQHTGDLLKQALKQRKISCVEVSGRVSNKSKALDQFRRNAQVLLASGAAAYGLNLQFCSRTVFFESPDDIASRKQAEKRTHRQGQKHSVYFYDLVVRGTYDQRILDALQSGKRVLDAVIDGCVNV